MDLLTRKPWITLAVGAVGMVVYLNTLGHGFVLDDALVILRNQYVRAGIDGLDKIFLQDSFSGFDRMADQVNALPGGRYRPLSLALFAILGALAGFSPELFHGLAVLVYGVACGLAYRWLSSLLADRPDGQSIALLTAVGFAVHPVHTEVVANIKGLDESLAFSLGLGSLLSLLRSRRSEHLLWPVLSGLFAFLACLAKEVAFMLVILAPLSLRLHAPLSWRHILRLCVPIWAAAVAYLLLRGYAAGLISPPATPDPLNDPFVVWSGSGWTTASVNSWLATVLYVGMRYLRLMIWPAGLTHDYYPFAIALRSFADPQVWLAMVLLTLLFGFAIRGFFRRDGVSFGLLWFFFALLPAANLFFSIGTFMGERFLFTPSLGLLLSFSSWLFTAARRFGMYRACWGIGAVLYVFLAFLTVRRNADWRSNETLMRSAAHSAAESAKWQNDMGTLLLDSALAMPAGLLQQATLDTALGHLVRATTLHPTYFDAWLAQGACAYYSGDYALTISAYRTASGLSPGEPKALTGWVYALRRHGADLWERGVPQEALPVLRQAWAIQPDTATGVLLWRIYAVAGQPDSAAAWVGRTLALAPDDRRLLAWVKAAGAAPR